MTPLTLKGLQSETLKYLFLLFSDGDTIPISSESGPTCDPRTTLQLIVCRRVRFQHGSKKLSCYLVYASSLTTIDTYRATRSQYSLPPSEQDSLECYNPRVCVSYLSGSISQHPYYFMSLFHNSENCKPCHLNSIRTRWNYKGYVFRTEIPSRRHEYITIVTR